MFKVDSGTLIGRPENPPAFPVEHQFQVGGETLEIADVPVQAAAEGEPARRLDVIAPVALRYLSDVRLFAPGSERPVEVEVTAVRDGVAGTLDLEAPEGWKVTPASQPFRLAAAGDRAKLAFTVKAPAEPATAGITAVAHVGDATWNSRSGRDPARAHPRAVAPAPARLKAVALDLAIKGRRVGYIPGAGDRVAESLEEMGYEVTRLTGADLTPEKLRGLDAVVIGVRAYNVRDDLAAHLPALFAYVEGGRHGRRPVQPAERAPDDPARPVRPAAVRRPRHRRERAGDVPRPRPPRADHAEQDHRGRHGGLGAGARHLLPDARGTRTSRRSSRRATRARRRSKGGLLVAKHGRGHFVYTGLVFFRQLPAGVPGPTGSSPTWSRSANDASTTTTAPAAAPAACRRTSRRTARPACRGRAPGRGSTCS